jgi:tRNA 2-thiouridine synthesizing protein E
VPTVTFEGKAIELDNNGYLIDFDSWTRELAVHMAMADGFKTLGGDKKHWAVLEFLRNLYRKNMLPSGDGEIIFLLTKGTGLSLGKLHRLFAGLSLIRLLKWAGLPPIACPAGA